MPSRFIAAALVAAAPALALAWIPQPPPGYGPPGYGYPGFPPPFAYPGMGPETAPPVGHPWARPEATGARPPTPPASGIPAPPAVPGTAGEGGAETSAAPPPAPSQEPPSAQPMGPETYPAPAGPPPGWMRARPRAMSSQLRVAREVTEDAYLVRILVGDGKTDEVQVTPLGRSLAISRSTDAQTLQEDSLDAGRGYQRSFSYSRGAVRRSLGLPPDADLSGMTREVKDGTITLRIPRSSQRGRGPGYGLRQPPVQGSAPTAPPAPMLAPAVQP